jgi:flagellin
MTHSIHTNSMAIVARQSFTRSEVRLADTQDRVSTGLKVHGAVDDASNFSIAQGVRGELRAVSAVKQGLAAARGTVNLAATAATHITDILADLRKKVIEASNPAVTTQQLQSLQTDVRSMLDQIDQAVESAEFQDRNLLKGLSVSLFARFDPVFNASGDTNGNGTINPGEGLEFDFEISTGTVAITGPSFANSATSAGFPFSFNTGANLGNIGAGLTQITDNQQDLDLEIPGAANNGDSFTISLDFTFNGQTQTATSTPITVGQIANQQRYPVAGPIDTFFRVLSNTRNDNLELANQPMGHIALGLTDLNLVTGNQGAVFRVDTALDAAIDKLSNLGVFLRSIDQAIDTNTVEQDAIAAGLGNIVDADMARESAELAANQLRRQLSAEMLAIANKGPQTLLGFF